MKISETRVAIFSDIHLGVHQNSSFWHEVSLKWCDWFVNELEKRNIKTILFLGDYFHYRDEVAVNTLDVGYKILSKLRSYEIYMIPGNHDSFYKEHAEVNSLNIFSEWPNLQILNKPTTVTFGNKSAAFIPWGGEINTKTDYLFGHFEINSFRMNSIKVCDKGYEAVKLLDKAKHIFSGHFHLRAKTKYENGIIQYVGNPFEMDFSDSEDTKGIYFLDFATDKLEFVENNISPKHIKLKISALLSGEKVDIDNVDGNIVKLVVDKKISVDNVEKILGKISGMKPAVASVDYLIDKNQIDIVEDANCDIHGVNMEGVMKEFVDMLEVDNKQSLYEKCVEIYNKYK